MKWKQTLRRNKDNLIELETITMDVGREPSKIVNVISSQDAAERLRKHEWKLVDGVQKEMVREWDDAPNLTPKGFFKGPAGKVRPKRH